MSVIDDYLGKLATPQKQALVHIRSVAMQLVPKAEDTIGYGMPVLKYKGKNLIGFCEFKNHLSIFPGAEPVEVLKDKLGAFTLSKGTVQFTLENPIPVNLLEEIINLCKTHIERAQ